MAPYVWFTHTSTMPLKTASERPDLSTTRTSPLEHRDGSKKERKKHFLCTVEPFLGKGGQELHQHTDLAQKTIASNNNLSVQH